MVKDAKPFPHVYDRNVCAIRQRRREDVPSIGFDIRESATELTRTRNARLNRAREMAPVLLGEELRTPVLVVPNPFTKDTTGFSHISHHGVLLHDPEDRTRMVMLYFRDTDGYYAGFQRCLVAEHDDGTKEENWGRSFFFDDMVERNEVPEFFAPVKLGVGSAHSDKGDYPGPGAVLALFNFLAGFEDHVHIHNNTEVRGLTPAMKDELQLHVGRIIIVFAEAMRLRTIYTNALGGLGGHQYSVALTLGEWNLLRSWGKISDYVLLLRKQTPREQMNLDHPLDPGNGDLATHGFLTMTLADLIGPNGELTLCKINVGRS